MKISHKLPRLGISRDGCDADVCVLANNLGSFLFLSPSSISKFNGFFTNYGLKLYKTVQNIGLLDQAPVEMENSLTAISRRYPGNSERIVCPDSIQGLIYTLSKKGSIFMDFDFRKMDDMRSFGRIYEVTQEDGRILVEFTKMTDEREDSTDGVAEFSFFAAIQPKGFSPQTDYKFIDYWLESDYRYDRERKDPPDRRYVYRPFMIKAKQLLIGVGKTKADAIAELDKLKKFKAGKKDYKTIDKKKDAEAAAAFICAQESLEKMKSEDIDGTTRLYAGYPWFFQFWSRDENVSLGALMKLKQFRTVKGILFKYLKNIGKDGRLANRVPSSHLGSADGVGWFWKRIGDFIAALKELHLREKYLSPKEMKDIRDSLADSIRKIEKNYKSGGLITNKDNETWMDTDPGGQDPRDGKRIEVQALHLNMLRLMHELSGDMRYKTKETKMRKEVIKGFWNGKLIADGVDDYTIRPNIFIAYYVYPDLLPRREWQTCFENALKKIWLDWGGLSSIDKGNPLFTPEYTGMDDRSYHRGDSWYWINNLAAICMFRNNAIEFEGRIKQIIKASSEEILWHGAIGDHAEISSASHLSSKGCFAQAWSAAIFIELMMETMGG